MNHPPSRPDLAWADRYVTVSGLRLRCRECGPQSALPVLLLHGSTGHAGMWEGLAAALAPAFRCIALDFRGYGQSDRAPGARYDRSDHAADVAAVVTELG